MFICAKGSLLGHNSQTAESSALRVQDLPLESPKNGPEVKFLRGVRPKYFTYSNGRAGIPYSNPKLEIFKS